MRAPVLHLSWLSTPSPAQCTTSLRHAPPLPDGSASFFSLQTSDLLHNNSAACTESASTSLHSASLPFPFRSELICSYASSPSLFLQYKGPSSSSSVQQAPQALLLCVREYACSRPVYSGGRIGLGMGQQLQPEGEVEKPGVLSPTCCSKDAAEFSSAGTEALGPSPNQPARQPV